MMLQGLEAFFNGEHVNMLSAGRRYKGSHDARPQGHRSSSRCMLASIIPPTSPVTIETVPANLDKVPAPTANGFAGVVQAIEIVDGSPRGLSQSARDRARIVHTRRQPQPRARSPGSDNHG